MKSMENKFPARFRRLFSVAEDSIKGCTLYGTAINVMHFTAAGCGLSTIAHRALIAMRIL